MKKNRLKLGTFDIHLQVGGEELDADLKEDLSMHYSFNKITPQYLAKILSEDALLVTRWSVLLNEAIEAYENAKIVYDVWEAHMFDQYRREMISSGMAKPSDTKVISLVKRDPLYMKKNKLLSRYKKNVGNIKAVVNGFQRKGDKVAMIASLFKMDYKPSPSTTYSHIERYEEQDQGGEEEGKE